MNCFGLQVITPSFPEFPPNIKRVTGLELLGSPLWGDDNFFKELSSCLDKVAVTQDKLAMLDDPQVELHLLRSCLSSCKIIHLLRAVPLSVLRPFLYQFDHNLHSCLSRIIQCNLSDHSWCRSTLSFRIGGLGLHKSVLSASAAFLGLCNSNCDLASTLLSIDAGQLSFPDEGAAAVVFSDFPSDCFISSASQQDLQRFLDQCLFDDLYASFSIRDQAHLTAPAHSSGTSSGWLKAIPRTCLGLVIPGPEFVVGLRLWLEVALFPRSPLCTCLSPTDCFDDHLLGCSHGPMRIRRHDALVDILYNALSQDHPDVLRSSVLPIMMAYTWVISSTLTSSMITLPILMSPYCSACLYFLIYFLCWGGAAVGELAKDEKHLAAVVKVGADFIPLVVETFGVWTPFALTKPPP